MPYPFNPRLESFKEPAIQSGLNKPASCDMTNGIPQFWQGAVVLSWHLYYPCRIFGPFATLVSKETSWEIATMTVQAQDYAKSL